MFSSVSFFFFPLLFLIAIFSELGCTVHFGLPMGQSLTDGLRGQSCAAETKGEPHALYSSSKMTSSPAIAGVPTSTKKASLKMS